VQFTAGPFAGLIGTLEQIDAQGRITILMNLFGRTSVIRSTASEVSPARIANP
jgi:transcription antitermination factor NusG